MSRTSVPSRSAVFYIAVGASSFDFVIKKLPPPTPEQV